MRMIMAAVVSLRGRDMEGVAGSSLFGARATGGLMGETKLVYISVRILSLSCL